MKSAAEPAMKQVMKSNPLLAQCSSSTPNGNSGGNTQPPSQSCDSDAIKKKGQECSSAMIIGMAGGNLCGAWSAFECCYKDAFSSCDASMQTTVVEAITSGQSMQFKSCEASMCSSETEEVLMATVAIALAEFSLEDYIVAVKKALGSTHVKAAVQYFKILVTYLVPNGATLDEIKQALKTANNVADNEVEVSFSSRRLGVDKRLLSAEKQAVVTFKVADKDKAVAVVTSAGSASTTQLETDLGGAASVASAPVTTVEVETKVRISKQREDDLTTAIEGAGKGIGGTITATKGGPIQVPQVTLNGSVFSSLSGVVVAAFIIISTTM